MAETHQAHLENRFSAAVEVVELSLGGDPAFRQVAPNEIPDFLKSRGCEIVWRKAIRVGDKELAVDVGLPRLFPDEVPIAFLADWKDFYLKTPHIEKNGFVCTIPDSAAVDNSDPAGVVRYVFNDCEQILNGTGAEDFRAEFSAYWDRSAPAHDQQFVVIDPVDSIKNPFPAVFGKNLVCIGSTIDRITVWLGNLYGETPKLTEEKNGVIIHLNAALLPDQYPNTLGQLLALAESNELAAFESIKHHLASGSGRGFALLVQKEGSGVALGGVVYDGMGLSRSCSAELTRGFRPGKIPLNVLFSRAKGVIESQPAQRSAVERVDHKWIHSRGGDGRDLSAKSVMVVGAGSLGGNVAQLLSRAGIGRITITDNDIMRWQNLGRHVLGAGWVGLSKALALAAELRRQMPHLKIEGIPKDWRDVLRSNPNVFVQHDLIVSTVADWRCEGPLNNLARNTNMPILCLGWLEPHAVAGHCLTIRPEGGCYQCGANELGQFIQAVAEFKTPPLLKEPGGCTYYQRYGPIAQMPVAAMIAETVVDSLLSPQSKSELKSWVSDEDHFSAVQAEVAKVWSAKVQTEGFSRRYHTDWPRSEFCTVCKREEP